MVVEAKASVCFSPFETIRTPDGKTDHSFGPYSETREHLDGWFPKLLSELGVDDGLTVELGSGHGQSAEDFLPFVSISGKCILSEPDEKGFLRCQEKFAGNERLEVRQKTAKEMLRDVESGSVNRIYYLNAIHLDVDRKEVIDLAFRKLAPGGLLIVNTAFTEEAEPESEKSFYKKWMISALRKLKETDSELFEIAAAKGESNKRMRRLSKAEYDTFFNNFKLIDLSYFGLAFEQPDSQLQNSIRGLWLIAQYEMWINGTMQAKRENELVDPEEYQRRLDLVTSVQQEALLEVYPKMIGPKISPRNNAIWVAKKPDYPDVTTRAIGQAIRAGRPSIGVVI